MKKIYLTFDVDWAVDDILEDCVDLLLDHETKATFFITHDTPLLKKLRKYKKFFELGIHPNFNLLLRNEVNNCEITSIIKRIKDIVPEAVSARSHSITQGSLIWDGFKNNGIKYDVNTFIPAHTQIPLCPFYTPTGLIRVPYNWEDDINMEYGFNWDPEPILQNKGFVVFDFHPIHVFLNSEKMERYENVRPYLQDFYKLSGFVNKQTEGTRDFLLKILENNDISFELIKEIKVK